MANEMKNIKFGDKGAAVKDLQNRLHIAGYLAEDEITGIFDDRTLEVLHQICDERELPKTKEVNRKLWSAVVDASFQLGDRSLYLRMPYFHGEDVRRLQQVLNVLGFSCGEEDGIFGAYTEAALRKFQTNMGLPTDGICGGFTFRTIENLAHAWQDNDRLTNRQYIGFSRASEVLEKVQVVIFGTHDFTRSVASRISNLAFATNPYSKIVSADALLVKPSEGMLMCHIISEEARDKMGDATRGVHCVSYDDTPEFAYRMEIALKGVNARKDNRKFMIELPSEVWSDAKQDRSAQHFAITILDALCAAINNIENN